MSEPEAGPECHLTRINCRLGWCRRRIGRDGQRRLRDLAHEQLRPADFDLIANAQLLGPVYRPTVDDRSVRRPEISTVKLPSAAREMRPC